MGFSIPEGAEAYFKVWRAPRGEKMPVGVMHRRPSQKAGEICGKYRPAISRSAGILENPLSLPLDKLLEESPVDSGEIGHDAGQPHKGTDDDQNHRENQ